MRFDDVVFLTVEQVEEMHRHEIARFGGDPGLRDRGLLLASVARPAASVLGSPAYPSLATMAAALVHSVARNHAFIDGNKRTALAAGVTFLLVNGIQLQCSPVWELTILRVARVEMDVDALAQEIIAAAGYDEPVS